jgi:hypothetical protein
MTEVDLFNQALAAIGDYRITVNGLRSVSSATAANPVACTATAHGLATNDLVLASGFAQMTQINGRVFRVAVLDPDTFQLVGEDGTAYQAEVTGGFAQRLTPGEHVEACFGVWPSMRREVLAEHDWNEATKYTRLSRLDSAKTITSITNANPPLVTSAAHGYQTGDLALFDGVVGMVELNGRYIYVTRVSTNTYTLNSEDSTGYAAYVSGGTSRKALTPLRPDFGYSARYPLPSDCVRVLTFAQDCREGEPWEVVGSEVFTDEGPTVPIRYTALLTDPARFSPKLFTALAARLAHELAPKITDSVSREQRAQERWEESLQRAKRVDSQQPGTAELADPPQSWLRSRY